MLDPTNVEKWRHWHSGRLLPWENPMLTVYGEDWWDAAKDIDSGWDASRHEYVKKICELWGLRQRKHKSVSDASSLRGRFPADLHLPV